MNDSKVVPLKSRPARPLKERVERAVERRVESAVGTNEALNACGNIADIFEVWYERIRIDPDRERPTPAELVYRVGLANDGVVFATPERARYVASLNAALDSKTWEEFRSRIPVEEWELITEVLEDDDREPEGAFSAEGVPGFCDGEWPPWLQKEISQVLPPPVLKKYVKATMSSINGVFFHIKQEDLPELLRELESRGIHAVHEPELDFN